MDNVKGFENLTPYQQELLIAINQRHKAGVGMDEKDGYTPVKVYPIAMSPTKDKIKVWFKNGSWLYYLPDGSWY